MDTMLNIGKKLNGIGRVKLFLLAIIVIMITLLSGAAVYGAIVQVRYDKGVTNGHKNTGANNDRMTVGKKSTSSKKDPTDKQPIQNKNTTSSTSTTEVPATTQQVTQSDKSTSAPPADSPVQTQPPNDFTLVASTTSVVLGRSEAHPQSASVVIRYVSGKSIEFLQVSKQPSFGVSSHAYIGNIVAGESSLAGTDTVYSRTLVVSQLVPDSPAISGTVYVTTHPSSPPLAIHISWNPSN